MSYRWFGEFQFISSLWGHSKGSNWNMTMASKNASGSEEELSPHPGKIKSRVWDYLWFQKVKEGPATKYNLNMRTVICILCKKKNYASNGSVLVPSSTLKTWKWNGIAYNNFKGSLEYFWGFSTVEWMVFFHCIYLAVS